MRWLDNVCEATNMKLTELWEAVEDRRAWRALVHGVTKSRTRLNDDELLISLDVPMARIIGLRDCIMTTTQVM